MLSVWAWGCGDNTDKHWVLALTNQRGMLSLCVCVCVKQWLSRSCVHLRQCEVRDERQLATFGKALPQSLGKNQQSQVSKNNPLVCLRNALPTVYGANSDNERAHIMLDSN